MAPLLGRFFGKRRNAERVSAPFLAASRGFKQEVVGESFYQRELLKIAGRKRERSASIAKMAILAFEDDNAEDELAVSVTIDGRLVGYLSRHDAREFRNGIQNLGLAEKRFSVKAKIVGGWKTRQGEGHYGVKLSLKWPLEILSMK